MLEKPTPPEILADDKVPEVILVALVVSVVAEAARPVIDDDGNVPVTFADGILPEALTACPSVERFLDNVI
jgi:hypothetical protein